MPAGDATQPLAYREDGGPDAPVLLMGSSLGTDGRMWEGQVAALTPYFRVVRYDHLGHGGSLVPDGPYDLDRLGATVLGLADALNIDRFAYAGLSLGGLVGQWLALNAPGRVTRLALVCTAAQFPPAQLWLDRAAAVRAGGMTAVSAAVVQRWFTPDYVATHPEVVAEHLGRLEAVPPEGYAACCEAIAGADLREDLPRINAPTLCIAATDDPATPPASLELIAAAVPGARLDILDAAAHLANFEQPERVSSLLVDHLTEGLS